MSVRVGSPLPQGVARRSLLVHSRQQIHLKLDHGLLVVFEGKHGVLWFRNTHGCECLNALQTFGPSTLLLTLG